MDASGTHAVDLSSLSAAERLLLAQDLWDSVVCEVNAFPMTDEERRWIDHRLARAHKPDAEWHAWRQVVAFARRDRSL